MLGISAFLSAVCEACMVVCSRFWFWYVITHVWYFSLSSSCLWGLYDRLQPLLLLVYNSRNRFYLSLIIAMLDISPFLPAVCGACMVDCNRLTCWFRLIIHVCNCCLSSSCLWGLYGGLQLLLGS